MTRRRLILIAALTLLTSLSVGVLYARAAASNDKPTMKVVILVKAKGNSDEVVTRINGQGAKNVYKYHIVKAVSATISKRTLNDLKKDGNIASVLPDLKLTIPQPRVPGLDHPFTGNGNNTLQDVMESEALQLTHAQDAWKITVNGQPVMGQGVKVGMLDTGTDPTHPDLAAAILAYRDFTGTGLRDNDGHGTATSSCVAAQGLPVYNPLTKTYMKVAGMAPKAQVLMAKVGDLYTGYDSQFMRGVEWLVDKKVDLISTSFGYSAITLDGRDPLAAIAVQAAIDEGVTFLVSASNEGPGQGTLDSPSDLPDAIAVGATTGARDFAQTNFLTSGSLYKGDQVIEWTSRAPNALGDFKPDIMAFGAFGWALAPTYHTGSSGRDIQEFGGTSMSAPVAAGNLALAECAYKLKHPGAPLPPPAYWKTLLASTASDLGYPALDGATGLVNGEAAVKAVLGEGPSFLVSVANGAKSFPSWSVKADGGSTASTTINVKNTGDTTEHMTLSPTVFADATTITRNITLTAATGYQDAVNFTIPSGTDFVNVSLTWPSGPNVSIRTAVYDSAGNYLNYGPTFGGYGHLATSQVSLTGPADQRPVVTDKPWTVNIFPRAAQPPTTDQPVHLRIEFMQKTDWAAVKLSQTAVDLAPGASADVTADLAVPKAAGTHFGGIVVGNGSSATTIPVAIRVPVNVSSGTGTFSGAITGSTVEYTGGEFYYYDFVVPSGTKSVQASLTWPDQGNLVNFFLVDPNGAARDVKGGDVQSYPDYAYFLVPPSAFTHTAEQVVWDAPTPGKWQVFIWAGGFDGNSFAEPYSGTIVLGQQAVSPANWADSAAPGSTVTVPLTVTNSGPTPLKVYAASRQTIGGDVQYATVTAGTIKGQLTTTRKGASDDFYFTLPQATKSVSVDVQWMSPGSLIDMGLYDPTGTSKAESLADSAVGNTVTVGDPMAGRWMVDLSFGSLAVPAPVVYAGVVSFVAPVAIPGLTASASEIAPVTVPAGGSATVTATLTVPAGAKSGSVIAGTLDFYSVGDQLETAGGDHVGSVPVTITVN